MKIKLTWQATGDYLLFTPINHDLAEWFVTTSQTTGYELGKHDVDNLVHDLNSNQIGRAHV